MLKADYSGALSMLLRYPSPQPHAPHTFVHDALHLEQNPTAERGSFLIAKYSGKPPESPKRHSQSGFRPPRKAFLWEDFKNRSNSGSDASSPARNSPKSLESLFQDVSQGIQRPYARCLVTRKRKLETSTNMRSSGPSPESLGWRAYSPSTAIEQSRHRHP